MSATQKGSFQLTEKLGGKRYLSIFALLIFAIIALLTYLIALVVAYQEEKKLEEARKPMTEKIAGKLRSSLQVANTCPRDFWEMEQRIHGASHFFQRGTRTYPTEFHIYLLVPQDDTCLLYTIPRNEEWTQLTVVGKNRTAKLITYKKKQVEELEKLRTQADLARAGFFVSEIAEEERKPFSLLGSRK